MTKIELDEIVESINNENSKTFSVSGVGNKLANRIINELKEKIKNLLMFQRQIIPLKK